MINTFTDITCPADCTTDVQLQAIAADQSCVLIPDYSQVKDLVITPNGAPQPFDFALAPVVTYTALSIDNAVADNSKSKHLVGMGGVAESEEREVELPDRQTAVASRKYTLIHKVSVKEDAVYNLLRQIQCGWTGFTFNYANVGGHIFGDSGGIKPLSVTAKLPLADGKDDTEEGIIVIVYEAKGDPRRGTWPL